MMTNEERERAKARGVRGVGLARLVAAGYVSDAASEGLDRVLYRITDAGKKELINLSFR
jgi:hypothetical protein